MGVSVRAGAGGRAVEVGGSAASVVGGKVVGAEAGAAAGPTVQAESNSATSKNTGKILGDITPLFSRKRILPDLKHFFNCQQKEG